MAGFTWSLKISKGKIVDTKILQSIKFNQELSGLNKELGKLVTMSS